MKTLRARLIVTYLLLVIISLGLLVWRVGTLLETTRLAETRRDQEGRAILSASATEELVEKYRERALDTVTLQRDILTLAREINQRITLLDAAGSIIVDSEHPLEIGLDEARQPEILGAREGRVVGSIRYDPDDLADALFTAAPVRHDGVMIGMVRLELPMNAIIAANRQTWLILWSAAALVAFATVLLGLWLASSVTRPLGAFTRAATRMADGDLKQRVEVSAPVEFAQMAHAFNFMAERIGRVMENQRAFVANAAHELRTPLTTIRLRAEALRAGAKDDPAVAEQFIADIEGEAERMTRLVNELLDLSRIDTGLLTPHLQSVAVGAVARRAAKELQPHALAARVTVNVEIGDAARVQADPDQLRQVFLNLIENALKFTPAEGRIDVRARLQHQVPDTGRRLQDTDGHPPKRRWVVVSVADSGVGIAAEDLPHIFERFYRGDKNRTRVSSPGSAGGTGLGLAIVKGIVEAHGGRVWAESEPGKGATISFALPIE